MDLGSIDIGVIPTPTLTEEPVNLPLHRLVFSEQNELQRHVNELLVAGLIIPSNSSYASPDFLVDKADKTKTLVIDYKQLNKHQHFPITHL